mmetsp:Transcript_106257/g.298870  ORF Transcript_106257/g.298870 Transcript_106257/m.298870 type:complete len:333 (-) Transcript_106257:125-1123(-)
MFSGRRLFAVLVPIAAARYGSAPCGSDEVQGELQGAPGYLCAPRCDLSNFNCPTDLPYGATAQPQCMLKDADQSPFCALLCQVDSQCPSGSQCKHLQQFEVGACLNPVSFHDWAKNTVIRKFAIGWPTRSNGAAPASFQIAKTYAALQSMKLKYSIDDGDADMVTLKEFMSSLSTSAVAGASAAGGASHSGIVTAASSSGQSEMSLGMWGHDVQEFSNNVMSGVPGIQKEIHDTIWNVEHITRHGVATMFLRSIILIGLAYLGIGCLIKSQMHNASGVDMVPHIGFWREYPSLVADGVTYLQILAGGYLGSPKTGYGQGNSLRGGVGSFDQL